MTKRLFSLLLMLALVAAGIPALSESVEDLLNPYSETVSVTVMGTDGKDAATTYDSSKPDRASANQNAWIDAYKRLLNIEVSRITPEDGTALTANLNTMMASGDLPDVMIVPKSMFYVMAENGVLQDIQKAFDAYDGRLWNEIKDSYTQDIWKTGLYEGETLGIPYVQNFYNNTAVLWVRQDWLDQLGLEVPATLDELEDVARAFIEHRMGGEGTIGIGHSKGVYTNVVANMLASYGVPMDTWVQGEDGAYAYANTLPACEEGLLRLREIYRKGLIKSDFSVTDIMAEEVANGVCGLYFAPAWHAVTTVHASLMNDENADWTCARIPTLDGGYVTQTTNATVNSFIVVNAAYEHPDVIFRLKELEAYIRYYATTDDPLYHLMTTQDNYTMWNLMVFRGLQRGDLDLYQSRLCAEAYRAGQTASQTVPFIQAIYEKCEIAMAGDRAWEGYRLVFLEGYPIVSDIVDRGHVNASYNGPVTENISLYQETINASLTSAMMKVVMGDGIEVYRNAVADWYANGGEAITADVNAYYGGL